VPKLAEVDGSHRPDTSVRGVSTMLWSEIALFALMAACVAK